MQRQRIQQKTACPGVPATDESLVVVCAVQAAGWAGQTAAAWGVSIIISLKLEGAQAELHKGVQDPAIFLLLEVSLCASRRKQFQVFVDAQS